VKVTSKASATVTRTGKGSATAKATRYAPTYEAALAGPQSESRSRRDGDQA